jgi:hypothetical protein
MFVRLYAYKECLNRGFKRDIFINSLYLILLLTLIIASLYELRELLIIRDYFLSFNDLFKVIRDISIKYKFSFKVLYKDKKRAWYKYNNKDCPWSIIAHLNPENNNKVIINIINTAYIYISNTITNRGAANY